MPVYRCYRGDVDNLPVGEPGSFVLDDTKGRQWNCQDTGVDQISSPDDYKTEFVDRASELLSAQFASHQQGLESSGTTTIVITAANPDELRQLLGERD